MKVGYSDFVKLCRVDEPKDWCSWLLLKGDGVYVKVPPGDVFMPPGERAGLSEHPTGNLAEPALRFPCTLNELQTFLEDQGVYGCIDAFDMADWVVASATKEPLAKIADKPLATTERNNLLIMIAAICDDDAINYQERGAAARIAELTDAIGARVSEDTVKRALDKIPNALESRMK